MHHHIHLIEKISNPSSDHSQLIGVMLGGLIGLISAVLGPLIIKYFSEREEKVSLKKIIINDLTELKKRLAPLSFRVFPKYGKLTIDNFRWIRENSAIDFSEGIEKLNKIGFNSEQIVDHYNTEGAGENKLSNFKKMNLFATDSHLINFGILDSDFMAKVLEIKFYINAFNEDLDLFREHLNMSFLSNISAANHAVISEALENKTLQIAEMSIYIVDKINVIIKNQP